jgi:hypothetical protein
MAGLLAACANSVEPGEPRAESAAPAAPITSGNQFVPEQQRLLGAMLSRGDAERYGLTPRGTPTPVLHAENSQFSLIKPCGHTLSSDAKMGAAVQGGWFSSDRTEDFDFHQIIAHYPGLDTTTIVSEVKQSLTCRSGKDEYGLSVRSAGQMQVAQAPEVQAQIVYCEDDAQLAYQRNCYLVAAIGERATMIDFNVFGTDRATVETTLSQRMNTLAPILEAAIARL